MMFNSLVMALTIAFGKIAISILSAYAVVYYRFPVPHGGVLADLHHADAAGGGAHLPDFKVVADVGFLDTYQGLAVPLIASATGTLLFASSS